jgi:uncharacterized membrane protein YesL
VKGLKTRIISYLESLRFPVLLIVAVVLFVVNVFVPDVIPFVDEALLALVAVILSRLKRRPAPAIEEPGSDGVDRD